MQSLKFIEMWEIVDQYSLKFEADIPESFLCIICKGILRNAKQIPCGCRYCTQCLETYLTSGNSFCPGDSEECSQQVFNTNMILHDDNFANKEISKLMMKCVSEGCNVRDCVRKMCDHVSICDLFMEVCLQCNEPVQRREMEEHLNNDCIEGVIECSFCNQTISRKLIESIHHNFENNSLCDLYECVCPYDCGVDETVVIKQHLRICNNRPLHCPYRELGCGADSVPLSTMEEHLCQEGYRHATILLQTISNLENEVNRMENAVNSGIEQIKVLEEKVADLGNENENLRINLTDQRNVIGGVVSYDNSEIQSMIMDLTRRLDLCDLKYEKKCFEYVWRIPNFKSLVTQSKNDWSKYVSSEPFFTSRNGFRIQMMLYANGLGDAKGHYISLYYKLLPGKFDDVLSWPFMHNVELRLLDQGGTQTQVVNLFFDPTDELMIDNYQRPPINVNIPLFGCPQFVSKQILSRIPTLKKHDTLFIQFSATPVNMSD